MKSKLLCMNLICLQTCFLGQYISTCILKNTKIQWTSTHVNESILSIKWGLRTNQICSMNILILDTTIIQVTSTVDSPSSRIYKFCLVPLLREEEQSAQIPGQNLQAWHLELQNPQNCGFGRCFSTTSPIGKFCTKHQIHGMHPWDAFTFSTEMLPHNCCLMFDIWW